MSDSIENRVVRLEERDRQRERDIGALSVRIDNCDHRQDALDRQIDAIAEKFSEGVAAAFEKAITKIDAVSDRFLPKEQWLWWERLFTKIIWAALGLATLAVATGKIHLGN